MYIHIHTYIYNYVSDKLFNNWLDNNNLPFEGVDDVIVFDDELVVVSRILEADDARVEDALLVSAIELFPLCKRFDNVLLVAVDLLFPAI